MWDRPDFLRLPERTAKPRSTGVMLVLDTGILATMIDGLPAAVALETLGADTAVRPPAGGGGMVPPAGGGGMVPPAGGGGRFR